MRSYILRHRFANGTSIDQYQSMKDNVIPDSKEDAVRFVAESIAQFDIVYQRSQVSEEGFIPVAKLIHTQR